MGVALAFVLASCAPDGADQLATRETVAQGARLDGTSTSPIVRAGDAPDIPSAAPEAATVDAPETSPSAGETAARAEPPASGEPPAGEPRMVSFADLSLIGLDVDAIFDPDEGEEGLEGLPASIRGLDRMLVAIDGYMIPMEWEGTRVKAFMLVRDMASCCFGQMPKPDEWVEVLMQADETTEYYPYVPVLATGILELSGATDGMGYVTSAYRLRGERVTDEW